ncbi:MAG: hypothetical protein KHZ58_08505 [Hungatella hathewayi]|nr:hypothetical protein [Hungatella hathewayi]
MSRFILHTKTGKREYRKYLATGTACLILALVAGYTIHSIGTARAKSRELVLLYTEEEFAQYLLDTESEEYNLNGRYQLEADLDLSWLEYSIGTNVEPFTGKLDGNDHVISGLGRPLFGVVEDAEIENLFLSEAEILSPFTYSDGEHYVDGYGALAAYAIDSRIADCGMNGEIYTASPSEAEYLLEKGNTEEDQERKGPGMEESTSVLETPEEIGPGLTEEEEGENEGDTGIEAGPGYESESGESIESESSAVGESSTDGEKGPTGETSASEESSSEEAGNTGGAAGEGTDNSVGASDSEEPGETENGGGSGSTEGTNSSESTGSTDGESVEETNNSNASGSTGGEGNLESEGKGETPSSGVSEGTGGNDGVAGNTNAPNNSGTEGTAAGQIEAKQPLPESGGTSDGTVAANISETVGYQAISRRQLMLKLPVMVDANTESIQDSIQTASPSDATPSDALGPAGSDASSDSVGQNSQIDESDMTFEEPEDSIEYIGNPDGDIYILVTAERVAIGGLIAETSGETLISNSFTLATISSALGDIETYTGGFVGITGEDTRIENSYASGLADSDDVTGGFTAIHNGFIQNSYSAMIIGESGNVRAAFCASGDGQLDGCVYDIQMACTDEIFSLAEELPGEEGYRLKGLHTSRMTGADPEIPGTWYTTEGAYPQIESFALSDQETITSASKVSAIALSLPEDRSLADAVTDGELILPAEIDGQTIDWEADGSIRIDENNQILIESGSDPETKSNNQINAAAR